MAGKILLIVLGDPEHRAVFNRALRETPHRLVFALDGEDAYDRFSEVKPDAVVMDVDLSRLEAAILCSLIRKARIGATIPIILYGEDLTTPELARARVEGSGATSALVKGWGEADLRSVVADVLPQRRVARRRESSQLTDPGSSPDLTALEDQDVQITLDGEGDLPMLDTKVAAEAMAQLEAEARADDEDSSDVTPAPASLAVSPRRVRQGTQTEDGEVLPMFQMPVDLRRAETSDDVASLQTIPSTDLAEDLDMARAPVEEDYTTSEHGVRTDALLFEELPEEFASLAAAEAEFAGSDLAESRLGRRLVERVRQTARLLDHVDYYQLLSVDEHATDAQIKQAYFDLSVEFHPDRFFLIQSGNLKAQIHGIFRRLEEAYAVLGDPRRRRIYDKKRGVQKGKRAPPESRHTRRSEPTEDGSLADIEVDAPSARLFIAKADRALADDDFTAARTYLSFSLAIEPDSPPLKAALMRVARRKAP